MRKTLLVVLTLLIAFNAHAVIGKGVPKSTVNLRQQNRIINLVNTTVGEEYVQGLWFFDGDRITTTIPDSKTADVGSKYPPAYSTTYVDSTTEQLSYFAYKSTNPSNSLTGAATSSWTSANGTVTNQRFHIDLGSAKVIKKIYYENYHNSGGDTDRGIQNFTFWGSNTAGDFADLVYANDGTWVQLTTSPTAFDQHAVADAVDPKYITVTNFTPYRYYAFKCVDNYTDVAFMGVRRIELQANSPAHDMTLGGAASTLSPSYSRFCPSLTMANAAATSWSVADSNDFSFCVSGVSDKPFTVIALVNPTVVALDAPIVGKWEVAKREWFLDFNASKVRVGCIYNDSTKYIIRTYNTALTADQGAWHCYLGTYDGGSAVGGLKIFRDGSQVDDTSVTSLPYVAMTNNTAKVNDLGDGGVYASAKYGVVIIISKELTPTEVATLSNALLIYSGAL